MANVYSSEIPTKSSGTLTHPLTLAIPATGPNSRLSATVGFPRLLPTALSYWLPWSVDCPVLLTALFCSGTFLPSSSSGLVGNLARKPFVWVSRQNWQRDPLTGTHSLTHNHTHKNECPTSCNNWYQRPLHFQHIFAQFFAFFYVYSLVCQNGKILLLLL